MNAELSNNRTFLMGLAMIAIVLCHHDWIAIPGFSAILSLYGLWGVDVFLFLSGFGCVYALNKYSTSLFLRRRVLCLLPTCLLAGILIFFFDLFFHAERTITYLPVRLLSIHRWYIQAILICYVLCPIVYYILKKWELTGLLVMVITAIVIEMMLPEIPVWKLKWAFGRLPVFLVGMYIGMFDLKMTRWQYVVSCIFLLAAILTRWQGGMFVFQWTFFLAAAMPFVCESLSRMRNVCIRLRIYHVIELFGIYSLEIYLIHEYFLWALYRVSLPLWCKYILFLTLVTGLVWGLKKTSYFITKKRYLKLSKI